MICSPNTSRRHYAVQRQWLVIASLGVIGVTALGAAILERLLTLPV